MLLSCVTAIRVGSTTVSIHQDGDGDVTPPVITPIVTGTLGGDGWYVGNVTVQWTVADPESAIVSQGYSCGAVTTIAVDAIAAPVTCEAMSHGGSSTQTVVIRRDATGPAITIFTPGPTLYNAGTTVTPIFSCSEPTGYSGVASCAISEGSTPLNTTPGWHGFTAPPPIAPGTPDPASSISSARDVRSVHRGLKAGGVSRTTRPTTSRRFRHPTPAGTLQYAAGAGRSWQSPSTTYSTPTTASGSSRPTR
jgi:hypothetical protein